MLHLPRTHHSARRTTDPTSALTELLPSWRAVLDAAGTNVFLADLDLTLVYANDRAVATLQGIEPELRSAFGVSVAEIVGGSIHRFHRNPARVESILRDGTTPFPHEATVGFGSVTLSTTIDAVGDPDTGEVIGYCVVWEDITALREAKRTTEQLAAELDEATRAIDELSASIGEVAQAAVAATDATARGVAEAGSSRTTVEELAAATSAIGEVVAAIAAIAGQTNILALNATIEAVRAGEAGLGFGVLAGEVKELARDTAAATTDIRTRIEQMHRTSATVLDTIAAIVDLLAEVDEVPSTVSATVEQQRVASEQLARSVAEASAASRTLGDPADG